MEAESVNSLQVLSVPADKPHEEPPNCVQTNCESKDEVPQNADYAPAMEGVDEGNAVAAMADVSNSIIEEDKLEQEDVKKPDSVDNEKLTVVHIEPIQSESIALDKPKRQRKKKEPKDYDAITSSSFCHAMTTSPSRAQNKSPSRGGRSPGSGSHSPARGGHSPVRSGHSPARGGHSPARGGHSPARGGYSPAHSCNSPVRAAHSPARGDQSPARGGQSPARGGKSPGRGGHSPGRGGHSPGRGGQSPGRGGHSPARRSHDSSCGGKSSVNGSQSPARRNHVTSFEDHDPPCDATSLVCPSPTQNDTKLEGNQSPCQKFHSPDQEGQDFRHGSCSSDNSTTHSPDEQNGSTAQKEPLNSSETTSVNGSKPVKKKASKKKSSDTGTKQCLNESVKECSKKAKKRKSNGDQADKSISETVPKNNNKQVKAPIINNKHSDAKDVLSEPKKKKRKKAVKVNDGVQTGDKESFEKENADAENMPKPKKKPAKKKKQSNMEGSVSRDNVDPAADTLDTITAVLNHVIAESTKCYVEDQLDNEKPPKSKKKSVAKKKSQLPNVDCGTSDKTITDNLKVDEQVSERSSKSQVKSLQANGGTELGKEKKPAKKKVVKSGEECKSKKKKPSVKSKASVKGGDVENDICMNAVIPCEAASDKAEQPMVAIGKDSCVLPAGVESVAGSLSSPDHQCTVVLNDIAANETNTEGALHRAEQVEQTVSEDPKPSESQADDKQGVNDHSNQEASEGSKKDDGAQSSGSSSENRVFQCPKCSYNSKKKVSLRRHMTVHGVYECAHCDFVSDQNSEYEDHMRDKHPSRCGRKLCKKCNVLFRVDEIEQHEKECTGEKKKWTCSECKKEFKFLCTMRAHVQKWHVSSGIKCEKCDFEANTNYTLKKHIMKVHKPVKEKKPISCTECNKTFSSDSCYRQHMKLHEGQEYQCPKCGKVFKSTRSMQTHLKIHEETKSVPCEVEGCTKVFKNAKVMEIHRKRCHENEPKKFKCTYGNCEQKFYTKYHLKRHEIMHTGERNFKCTYPDCTKAFHHAENLKVHLRSHNNIKCPQCRRTFKEESSLQTHLKVHENAKSRSKKKRKPVPADNAEKPTTEPDGKPSSATVSSESEASVVKPDTSDSAGKEESAAPTAETQTEVSVTPLDSIKEEGSQSKKEDSGQHDVYDFHDSDDEKLAVSAIARQTSPNKSPRIKIGGELLGTLPLPSAPDAMLAKSVAVADEELQPGNAKKKKKPKKKKIADENSEGSKPSEVDSKPKEKKKPVKKKKAADQGDKQVEDESHQKNGATKEEDKAKKPKKPKKKAEKKNVKKESEKKQEGQHEKEETETKVKKKKPQKKKSEKQHEVNQVKSDEIVEPEKKKKKKKPKKVEEQVPVNEAEDLHQEPEPVAEQPSEPEPEPIVVSTCKPCSDENVETLPEPADELPDLHPDEDVKSVKDEQGHQSEPEIGPQPSPTPEYLDDQQHGFFSPRPEQVEFQYPMAPRPVSPEEDDDDIGMMEVEESYKEEQPEQSETKVLESPLSEMSSEMKSLTLPSVSRESPCASHDDNDHHSDLVAELSPTIKDISGQEDKMLSDIAKQVEAESAIAEEDAAEMPPSNYPSSIHTTPPSVQPPSVPPGSVPPPPPQEVAVITSHTSHIMEESSAIGDMVSRYEGEAAARDLYQAPLSNSSNTQQHSSHHYSGLVDQQLPHKYLQEAPLSVQSHGHLLAEETSTPTSSSPPSIPPPAKYYMDGSSYPPSVYHSHRVPSVPPSDLPPTSPSGPAETTPTYSGSLSHGSSHYRSDSQTCPSYPPRDSLPTVTTPSYPSPPQNSYMDPHSASMVNNKEDTAVPSVSSTERTSDSLYLTTRSSNLPTSAGETLPANSSAPPSVSFGSDSLPARELFGQYFGQDSTGSMPLTHPPLSQEQRGLPYPHSQPQTSLPTLPGANSADYFRRASAPFIPGTGYPSVTETLVPPPPQHWMSAHDERSRQWGQPSPIIAPPIPAELDSASPLSRNPYVSRPSDYSFNPTTTSHSSKQTESSYPGSQGISTPAERATYDMTSAYMTGRTFNPNYTGPMPPPPPSAATQKQLEEAYRRAAQISDYRTLSQAAPPSMADMYSRMAVPPALGFDKYYYSRDAMFRSQHLSAAPNPFMTQSSTPQMPYTERDYGRNPIYTQHGAYGFMGDKQYLASNKLPPTLPGLQERPMPTDYLQSPAAAAAMSDPHIQDPYRRSVIYNMMSRYF